MNKNWKEFLQALIMVLAGFTATYLVLIIGYILQL